MNAPDKNVISKLYNNRELVQDHRSTSRAGPRTRKRGAHDDQPP